MDINGALSNLCSWCAESFVYCLPGGTIVRPSDRWNRTRRHLRLECRTCDDWRRRGWPRWWWRGVAGRIWAIFHFDRIPRVHPGSFVETFHRTWRLNACDQTVQQHRHQDHNRFKRLLLVAYWLCKLVMLVSVQAVPPSCQIWTGFGDGLSRKWAFLLPRRQDLEDDDDVATGRAHIAETFTSYDVYLVNFELGTVHGFWNVFTSQERSEMQIQRDGPQALWLPRFGTWTGLEPRMKRR